MQNQIRSITMFFIFSDPYVKREFDITESFLQTLIRPLHDVVVGIDRHTDITEFTVPEDGFKILDGITGYIILYSNPFIDTHHPFKITSLSCEIGKVKPRCIRVIHFSFLNW